MKRFIFVTLAIILVSALIFTGCAQPAPAPTPTPTPAPAPAPAPAPTPAPAPAPKPAPAPTPAPAAPAKPIVLKCVSHPGLVGPTSGGIFHLIDEVKARSKGELTIDLLGSKEVMAQEDLVPAVKSGVLDFAYVSSSFNPGLVPEGLAVSLSQLPPWEERETGFWGLISDSYKKAGLYPLGRGSVFLNTFYLFTSFPVTKPQELAGHKFRGQGPYIPLQKALGIISVPMSPTETYGALEQGLIDGLTWKVEAILSYKVHEAGVKYVINHPYACDDILFMMSVDGFNKLPQHLQKLLMDTVWDTERWNKDMWDKRNAEDFQALLKAGVKEIKFSPADAKWYTDLAWSSGWEDVLKQCPVTGPKLKELSKK